MARLSAPLVLFFLLNGMEAFSILPRLVYGEWDGKGGDKISQGLNLLMMAASLGLCVLGRKGLRRFLPGLSLALAVLALIALSALWSIDPGETFKRAVLYSVVVCGAAGLAGAFEAEALLHFLLIACGLSAVASLVAYFAIPGMGRMAISGELRGVFPHKNVIGPVMAIGGLAAFHTLSGQRGRRMVYAALLTLFVVCAAMSRSATSLLTIFAYGTGTGLAMLLRHPRFRALGVILTALAIPLVLVAAALKDTVLGMLGKDPTLTGRTVLWGFVEDDIRLRPLFGWGYSAFWQPDNPAANAISLTLGWYVPQAHNGILEILIELGFVGVALFITLWFRNLLLSVQCLRTQIGDFAATAVLFYVSLLIMGASEAILLEPFELSTMLFFLFSFICERERHRSKERRRSPASRALHFATPGSLMPQRP
jgi:O-antigen ligase